MGMIVFVFPNLVNNNFVILFSTNKRYKRGWKGKEKIFLINYVIYKNVIYTNRMFSLYYSYGIITTM